LTTLSVFIASSVDGFIADAAGDLGWLEALARVDEDYGYQDFLSSVDALAMGRATYDHIAHLDPLPFGTRPVYVFTHRPAAPRTDVTFWDLSPRAALEHWRERGLSRVYVDGGRLITSFLDEGLIDDMVLTTAPVLLGRGRPLFGLRETTVPLRLENVTTWPSGFVRRTYTRIDSTL
jgi:dihydrofolate reductase